MITKQSIIKCVENMCSCSPVSFENQGAFLFKLFMYPVVDQAYITKSLSFAVQRANSNIVIVSVHSCGAKELKYQYIIDYKMTCAMCGNRANNQVNVFGRRFIMMCPSCRDDVELENTI